MRVEEENLFITKTGNEIVTDAGWEKISFKEARKLFSPETFQEWYELFLENTDIAFLNLVRYVFKATCFDIKGSCVLQ
ncbi:hypothetical protein [Nostoc sp.]|uniref:hypothetical protein n=1 Tax=Nostoc sp. TaxID=1180 RepID=UPI002FF36047